MPTYYDDLDEGWKEGGKDYGLSQKELQERDRDRWIAMVEQPESQTVAELNKSVRILREEFYQLMLRKQKAEESANFQEGQAARLQMLAARFQGEADDAREALAKANLEITKLLAHLEQERFWTTGPAEEKVEQLQAALDKANLEIESLRKS